jgi:glc operon protein GlcG
MCFAASALALVAGLALAQGPQGGRGGNQPVPPQSIDLATARKMVAAAEAAAVAMHQHVAICVMDVRGDIVLFQRMDTLDIVPGATSQGKARAVLMLGVPTGQVADAIRDGKEVTVTVKRAMPGAGEVTFMRGGLPILKAGKLIGAIGVGGSASENDEKFAQAGIDAIKD